MTQSVEFLGRGWRPNLESLASTASESLLIASPYIKVGEAQWICGKMHPGVEVTTLANIDADAVSTSALDIAALVVLASASSSSRIVALPSLHAKVFVADDRSAIVTSGNLTRSGLDTNIEYGVLFRDSKRVRHVRKDMMDLARLGSSVSATAIAELEPLEAELREARAHVDESAAPSAKRRFEDAVSQAQPAFAGTHVGNRSAHAVFGDAIKFVLASGPRTTTAIKQEVRMLLPALCDDRKHFFINGEPYGREWHRRLRHAQQHLKRKGIVAYDSKRKTWQLARPPSSSSDSSASGDLPLRTQS